MLAGTTLGAVALAFPALAQDATWVGNGTGTGSWSTSTNWTPATVPTGTATFATSPTTTVTIGSSTGIDTIRFNAGASAFTFNKTGFNFLTIGGTNGGVVNNSGVTQTINVDTSFLEFDGGSAGTNVTINDSGSATFTADSTGGSAAINVIAGSFLLSFTDQSSAGAATITTNATSKTQFSTNATGGNARLITNGASAVVDFSNTVGLNSDNKITAGTIEGDGLFYLGQNQLTVGGTNLSMSVSGVISDCGAGADCNNPGSTGGSLVKAGTGTLTLSGTNTYSGPTTVNAGTLSIASGGAIVSNTTVNSGGTFNVNGTAAAVTINAGGTLSGNGTVGNTTFNGGTLAPGNSIGTITINGNLVLSSATTYLVEVSPTQADRTNVTGTATLGGASVQAVFGAGSYVARSYTILSATGGRSGTFGSLTTSGLPAGFTASLSYTNTDANLDLKAFLGGTGGLNINQSNVATSLNTFFNNGGTLPPAFVTVFGLTGQNLGNGLSQLSGEPSTGIQQAGFQTIDLFLNAMLDPFVMGGRSGGGFGAMGGGAMGYAPEQHRSSAASSAFASINKAPPQPTGIEQRWGTWGAAYGGYNHIDGDPVVGSHDTITRTGGFAGGADYRVSPDTVLGAALAMGETTWGLSALGGGRSEHAQLGVYGSTRRDAAYLSAAFAAGWHRASTSRTVSIGTIEALTADFDAATLGGRIETGYRFGSITYGVTPYAAVQMERVDASASAERSALNAFALRYAGQNGDDTRSELGAWLDTRTGLANGGTILWRGRAAWVHEFNASRDVLATFQALPGASFTVNGALPARNAALTSAAAELRLADGLSFIAKFDGQFADGARTYAGTATLRKTW